MVSDIEIFGRKTFFIAPDPSLISDKHMEELCLLGYEAYIIKDDGSCPLLGKVEAVIKNFPNSILYLNIDHTASGIDWKGFARKLRAEHCDDALFGVTFLDDGGNGRMEEVSGYYARDIGLSAGCIALKRDGEGNLDAIKKTLNMAGAKGRRNYVRAACDADSSVSFSFNGKFVSGKVEDTNIVHFRCQFPSAIDMKIFDKIHNANVHVNGMEFPANAVLLMKRQKGDEHTYIFMFMSGDQDEPGLEPKTKQALNKKIHQIVEAERMRLLQGEFKKLGRG